MTNSDDYDPLDGIAIVGMAGRFPDSPDVSALWQNLLANRECISRFEADELDPASREDMLSRSNPGYVRARGILDRADEFDEQFFGFTPREAEILDPQQRLFMQAAWEALEHAGHDTERFDGPIGVFAGATTNTYHLQNLLSRSDVTDPLGPLTILMGNANDYVATRVSYKLDLKGPALNIQNACSTSLVAVCTAVQSLQTYQCDMALAGGVSVQLPQRRGYLHEEGSILAPDGHCRAFDRDAAGTVFSNGLGVVVLRRLSEAIEDGDTIYAVIKGAALNNDGSAKVSFTAPSVDGHAQVIAMAQMLGGIDPSSISYIEAHGTGTALGDPIEIAGLTQAFRDGGADENGFCAIGSIKPNIGHLDVAAGVAGLIKTTLALHNKVLPATINFTSPNPNLDIENTPFFVNTTQREWPQGSTPRRAGVSSFGVGGTNAHVVLEEAPETEVADAASRPEQLLVLSARDADGLDLVARNLKSHLESDSTADLADIAYTLQVGRRRLDHRRSIVCHSRDEAIALLTEADPRRVHDFAGTGESTRVAFMFPGQGSQYVNMGRRLYESEPVFRQQVDECARVLESEIGVDLRSVLYPEDADTAAADVLKHTAITQPALFVVEYALAQLWMSWGVTPAAMIGHSVGEYVAACLGGTFERDDALVLVARRARLMESMPAGAMLGVRAPADAVAAELPAGVSVAAINAPNHTVVSGDHDAITELEAVLTARSIAHRRLHTSHAYHSAMMDQALEPFTTMVADVARRAPEMRWISSVTGRPITDDEAVDPHYWARQLREPVQFARGVGELVGSDIALIEVGPGQTLTALSRQHEKQTAAQLITTSLHPGQDWHSDVDYLLAAAGRLWARNVDINWRGFHGDRTPRRVPLPTYPFRRQRHWVNPATTNGAVDESVPQTAPGFVPAVPQAPQQAPASSDDRSTVLLSQLRKVFVDLSGVDPTILVGDTNFLEIGFDSLFLTQVSSALQKQFKTKVTVRTLLEDAPTLNLLVDRILPTLPADALPAPGPAAPVIPTSPLHTGGTGALADVAQQLADIARQLEALSAPADTASTAVAPRPGPVAASPAPTANSAGVAPTAAFGPYRPPKRTQTGGVTDEQRHRLAEIIARYNDKTAKSKASADENRAHLADPRTVSGFRQSWKEMVYPIVSVRSSGAHLTDVDGNDYVDITNGFGMIFFGHNPKFIRDAVDAQYDAGIEIGPQTPLAGEVARLVCDMVGMERAAFCSTGSEAVMAAIRVARTVTGRDKIVMFTGAYHGIFDEVLVRPTMSGDGRAVPIAPGIPAAMTENILVLEYGTPETIETIKALGDDIAAVLVETVQSRRPELQPREFLHELRRVTEDSDTALIFDEVVTGFRTHPGGAQALFGVQADIAAYGKVVGGGLPIGIVAGRAKYLDALDGGAWNFGDDSGPEAGVTFFAGTFVRHPLALAAARAVLLRLKEEGPELQRGLNLRTTEFVERLRHVVTEVGAPVQINHFSSWFVVSFPQDLPLAPVYYTLMRGRGVHTWEGRPCFLTLAHTDADLDHVVAAFKATLLEMQDADFLPRRADEQAHGAAAAEDPFVLTEAQREICAVTLMSDEANCSYNQCFVLHLDGPLSVESMHAALGVITERHEALRLSIDLPTESQSVAGDVVVELPLTDLSGLDESAREQEIERVLFAETHTPFDLAARPLWRARVIREAPERHRLIFTAHHVIADGWSSAVIFGDLARAYAADRLGLPAALPAAASFRDFVAEHQTPAVAAETTAALEFWKKQYQDGVPAFELPLDRPRPPVKTYAMGQQVLTIDRELYRAIRTCAARNGATQFVALLATFELLIARLAAVDDFTIGVPLAGQALQDNGHLVAHGVNTIPLRCHVDTGQSFEDHLRAVSKAFLEAQAHPRLTFGTLVNELRLPRDPSRTPLVSVIFNIDRLGSPFDFGDLAVTAVDTPKAFDNFDFGVNAVDDGETLRLECQYNRDLFDASTVAGWLARYRALLSSASSEPGASLVELSAPTDGELAALVGSDPIPTAETRDDTLHGAFARQAAATPDAIAVSIDMESGRRELTYAEIDRRADVLAAHLRSIGVGANDVVGLRVHRGPEIVIGMLAILKAGGAYLPMDARCPVDRVAFIVSDAAVRVVLTQSALAGDLSALPVTSVSMDAPLPAPADQPASRATTGDDLAYVIYTSGSTGEPKGVPITHRKVLRLYANEAAADFGTTDVWTLFHSCAFDAAVWAIWGALMFGGRLVIVPENATQDMAALRRLLLRERVTVLDLTPTAFHAFVEADLASPPCAHALRFVVLGGESLEPQRLEPWFDRYGDTSPVIVNAYGPTETTVQVTYRAMTRADVRAGVGSIIGVPLPDTRIYVLDGHGQPVPTGVTGEMYIAGGGVADGYLNRPDLTAQRFLPDPFHGGLMFRSGDLARRLPNGELEYLGRIDKQVKIRGYRIELGEVETVIAQHPAVRQVAVIDRDDAQGERSLVAYLVADDRNPALFADIRDHLRSTLPEYMVPSQFSFIDEVPRVASGKLDRDALPAPEEDQQESAEVVAPRTPSESLVVGVFQDVLDRDDVSVFDNFFDLGGHSLMAARVMAKLRDEARISLPLRNLFERPTPEQLAAAVDALSWAATDEAVGGGQREEIEL